jgi:hypothetical protein
VAINFPTSLDNFTNPSSGNTLDSPSHSLQHSDINDAVEAMQRKVGVGTSVAGSASAGQVLTISAAGTSTWSTPTAGGLIQIVPSSVAVGSGSGTFDANGRVTFTGASSISLNDVFNSTYDAYRIHYIANSSSFTDGNLRLRFRVSGADNTTSNYYTQVVGFTDFNNTDNFRESNSTSFFVGATDAGNSNGQYSVKVDFFNVFNTNYTNGHGQSETVAGSGALTLYNTGHLFNATTSFTGFTLYPSGGSFTGTISVYGYR